MLQPLLRFPSLPCRHRRSFGDAYLLCRNTAMSSLSESQNPTADPYASAWPTVQAALSIYERRVAEYNLAQLGRRSAILQADLRQRYGSTDDELRAAALASPLNPPPEPAAFAAFEEKLTAFCRGQLNLKNAASLWPGLPTDYMALMHAHDGVRSIGFPVDGLVSYMPFQPIAEVVPDLDLRRLMDPEDMAYTDRVFVQAFVEKETLVACDRELLALFRCGSPDWNAYGETGIWWCLVKFLWEPKESSPEAQPKQEVRWMLVSRPAESVCPTAYDSVQEILTLKAADGFCQRAGFLPPV
ncbi:hypothetical protein B0J12DRAFT_650718 [Macrophomina phaseolina]|uniref:Uncharacterized protein n=1 Tax=Macrophomina phaseolina TaxID=35725 RepID=A0ABQ8GMQ2_9PEZI|nr:hypothetical protein B0J12DRAFT_650718 [Macrophomina phaseolina]